MSQQVPLAAHPRAGQGKGEARALRRSGRVPAIAYGAKLEPTSVSVDGLELYHALRTEAGLNAVIRLDLEGDSQLALAREIQRHPVRREIMHVDFVAIDKDVKVTVDVPIHTEGEAPGADEGGVLDQPMFTLSVEVLPLEVPSEITVDVSSLQIGDVLRVEDLTLPSGVTALHEPDEPVVSVVAPTDEPAEPDVDGDAMADTVVEGEEPEAGDADAESGEDEG